jgi:multidrug efflux pump subunit AcrA (membrane-fusion protein)
MILEWERPIEIRKRLNLWLLIAAMIAIVIWATIAEIKVYAVVRGTLEPRGQTVTVPAPIAGRVLELRVKRFDHVKRGQELFVLDAVGANASATKLQLRSQRSQLDEAQSSVAQARTELIQRQRLEGQLKRIYEAGATPLSDYQTAGEHATKARQLLDQAIAREQGLRAQLEGLQGRERIVVTSPVSGQVAQLAVRHNNEIVALAATLAEIVPEGVPLVFNAVARASDRPKLRVGANVEVAWDGYPSQKFGISQGKLRSISATSVAAGSFAGSTPKSDPNATASYPLEINLERLSLNSAEGKQPLLVGLGGEARVLSARKKAILLCWDWIRGLGP